MPSKLQFQCQIVFLNVKKAEMSHKPKKRCADSDDVACKVSSKICQKISVLYSAPHTPADSCKTQMSPAGVSRSLQESPGVCRSLPESAGVFRSLQESPGVCRSLQESAGVCRSLPESAGLLRTPRDSIFKYYLKLNTLSNMSLICTIQIM